jgi:hypothetical protein
MSHLAAPELVVVEQVLTQGRAIILAAEAASPLIRPADHALQDPDDRAINRPQAGRPETRAALGSPMTNLSPRQTDRW